MGADKQQVLELVLPHVTCVQTLLNCSTVSTSFRSFTRHVIQQKLPTLVAACPGGRQHMHILKQMLTWLCRNAGAAAVEQFPVGCALLDKVHEAVGGEVSGASAAEVLAKTGLQLTPELLVHMVKQRVRTGPLCLFLADKGAAAALPQMYLQAATWGLTLENHQVTPISFLYNDPEAADAWTKAFSSLVTTAMLPAVLLLLVWQAAHEPAAAEAAEHLLQTDKSQMLGLHNQKQADSSSIQAGSAGAACSIECRSDAVQDQQQALEQQLAQQRLTELVEEALTVCVTYDMSELCKAVAALPAAQDIGPAKVTELLYVAFMQLKSPEYSARPSSLVIEAVTGLPAAASVSTDCVASLIDLCLLEKQHSKLGPLLRLPGAKQLSSRQICNFIDAAGRTNQLAAVQQLCRLADGRTLERDRLLLTVSILIRHTWATGDITHRLNALNGLQPGRHLTAEDLLELIDCCIENKSTMEGIKVLATWQPAADQITDIQRFLTQLITAAARAYSYRDQLQEVLTAMPAVTERMQRSDWMLILLQGLCNSSDSMAFLGWVLQQHPDLQEMSAGELGELLQTLADVSHGEAVTALSALPAMQDLPASVLVQMLLSLLAAAEHPTSSRAAAALLTLPQAQQLSVECVQQLLDRATDHGARDALGAIRQLPAAAGLQVRMHISRLEPLLERACDPGSDSGEALDVCQLLQEPAAQELSAGQIVRLLSLCMHCSNREGVSALQQLPVFQELNGDQVLTLACAALESGAAPEFMPAYVAHPAAADIDPEVLVETLKGLIRAGQGEAASWQALLQLPAMQELDSEQFVELLKHGIEFTADLVLSVLLRQPPASAVDAAAGQQLIEKAMQRDMQVRHDHYSNDRQTVALLLGLPCIAHFEAQQFRALLWRARELGCREAQGVLVGLPAVQAAAQLDGELAAMLGAWKLLWRKRCW